jgi:hypothetical protein
MLARDEGSEVLIFKAKKLSCACRRVKAFPRRAANKARLAV